MLRIPFQVLNRFGDRLAGADVNAIVLRAGERDESGRATTGDEGSGLLTIDASAEPGRLVLLCSVLWTDAAGVTWGVATEVPVTLAPSRHTPGHLEGQEIRFIVNARLTPQGVPLPELRWATRAAIRARESGERLHERYEEARDAILAGLPNAGGFLIAKALENATWLRGLDQGWPVHEWVGSTPTPGGVLEETEVELDIGATFGENFYERLLEASVAHALGDRTRATGVPMDEARSFFRMVTQLLEGWFGPTTERAERSSPDVALTPDAHAP